MSIINSLFVSEKSEALKYAVGEETTIYEVLDFGGITDIDMSNLYSIAAEEEFDFDIHEFLPVDEDQTGELFELPMRMISYFPNLSKTEIAAISKKWAKTEELNCSSKNLKPIVSFLVELSKKVGENHVYFTQG